MTETPMGQLALMYKLIEDNLRKSELSLHALRQVPEIRDNEKSAWQVRDILKVLDKHQCILKIGQGRGMSYKWDPTAPPFTLNLKAERLARKQPGPVAVTRPHTAPKEMEIEFAGVILTLGVSPTSGRFRIIIEEKEK